MYSACAHFIYNYFMYFLKCQLVDLLSLCLHIFLLRRNLCMHMFVCGVYVWIYEGGLCVVHMCECAYVHTVPFGEQSWILAPPFLLLREKVFCCLPHCKCQASWPVSSWGFRLCSGMTGACHHALPLWGFWGFRFSCLLWVSALPTESLCQPLCIFFQGEIMFFKCCSVAEVKNLKVSSFSNFELSIV